MLRRRSVGLDGTESEYCDLSGRGLTTAQVERTLRVFDTAMAIDMSNNELEMIPTTIPATLLALDVSFNLIAHVHGIDRLKNLQELHLGYNRLSDVSILEFCPLLQRLNLSGNRLVHTRGIETLANLENLDLSDNLIESPEAFRALSLNLNLTHLTLRGNPIVIKSDYRVWVVDMIPSVLILDDKKIRTTVKCKSVDVSATKSLSYARIYDDKKQFMIRNTNRRTPASRPASILVGNPNIPPKFEGNTVFLQSPTSANLMHDTIPERMRSPEPNFDCGSSLPPAPLMNQSVRLASPTAGAPYMSLYDRLAQANGIPVNKQAANPAQTTTRTQEAQPALARSASQTRRESQQPSKTAQPAISSQSRNQSAMSHRNSNRGSQVRTQSTVQSAPPPAPDPTRASVNIRESPPTQYTSPTQRPSSQPVASTVQVHPPPLTPPPSTPNLDPKQRNVLNVIQNLIQHKKQTLATLAQQSSAAPATTVIYS